MARRDCPTTLRQLASGDGGVSTVDVAIVGAGPVGLTLVSALSAAGVRVGVIDPQAAEQLASPLFDGREIALTPLTRERLGAAGIWDQLDPAMVWPLQAACIRDRGLPFRLDVCPGTRDPSPLPLGWMVSNWRLRQAAWRAAQRHPDCVWLLGRKVESVRRDSQGWGLGMSGGQQLHAGIVIAADSRFSTTRRLLGVGARSHDHGTAMVVRTVTIERDHHGKAWEWFGGGCTRALLPLQPGMASAVVTLSASEAQRLIEMEEAQYNARISTLFEHRWGDMRVASSAHLYPMVTVYADRFAGRDFALAGDAAVGMHPLTAHGFNFGVRSAMQLAQALGSPLREDRQRNLMDYAARHRRATLPLYAATAAVAGLYADMRGPARLARAAALAAATLPPFTRLIQRQLAHAS